MITPRKQHKVIWLQPFCLACEQAGEERAWCQDNVWEDGCECGEMPVKYVLALEQPVKKMEEFEDAEVDGDTRGSSDHRSGFGGGELGKAA